MNRMLDPQGVPQGSGGVPQGGPSAMLAPQGPPAPPNPGTLPGAPPQKQVTIDHVKEVIKKQTSIVNKLDGLLADDGKATRQDVVKVATQLVAERVMSAPEIAGLLKDLPKDPEEVTEWVRKHAQNAESGLNQLLMMIHGQQPEPPPEMTGAEMKPGQTMPISESPTQ